MFKNQEFYKIKSCKKILKYLPKNIKIIGLGSGTTINYLIYLLKNKNINFINSTSKNTTYFIKKNKINILKINNVFNTKLNLYIDSADQINYNLQMIKGGGKAFNNEKIISFFANIFLCLIDKYKIVNNLGENKISIPIEILPYTSKLLINYLNNIKIIKKIKNYNIYSENNNLILNIFIKKKNILKKLEYKLNNIPGIISNGLFINRKANILILYNKNIYKIY